MSDTLKKTLISIATTFGATFLATLGASIITIGTFDWTFALIGSLIVAAARTAVKAVVDQFVPV